MAEREPAMQTRYENRSEVTTYLSSYALRRETPSTEKKDIEEWQKIFFDVTKF
jgi:hypothetical protein